MQLGLHIVDFEERGKPIRATLKDIAQYADGNGVASLSVMDHFFQIGMIGPPEMNMPA